MNKITFILIAVLWTSLVACNKSSNDITGNTETSSQQPTRLVKKIITKSDGSILTANYYYNDEGQLIRYVSEGTFDEKYKYDRNNRLVSVEESLGDGLFEGITYDKDGMLRSIHFYTYITGNLFEVTTEYIVDKHKSTITSITENKKTILYYKSNGLLDKFEDITDGRLISSTRYIYHDEKLDKIITTDHQAETEEEHYYQYDNRDRIIKTIHPSRSTEYIYEDKPCTALGRHTMSYVTKPIYKNSCLP